MRNRISLKPCFCFEQLHFRFKNFAIQMLLYLVFLSRRLKRVWWTKYTTDMDILTEKTTVCHYLVVRNKKCVERKALLMGRLTDASFRWQTMLPPLRAFCLRSTDSQEEHSENVHHLWIRTRNFISVYNTSS